MNLLDNGAGDASQPTGGIPSRHRRAKALGAASVALGLAVSVAGVAGAATSTGSTTAQTPRSAYFGHHGAHPGAGGTVASVGTNSFTLTDRHSTTVIVDLSSTTTFEEPGTTSPSLADVKVGDRVFAVGTEASGTVTATKVFIGGAGDTGGRFGHYGAHPGAGGTVASVGTSSFTLTDRHSTTVIVDLSSTTTFEEPGNTSPSSADVKVGDRVFAVGTEASGTVTATKVFIGGAGGTGGRFAWGSGDHGASQWRSSTAPSAQGAAA